MQPVALKTSSALFGQTMMSHPASHSGLALPVESITVPAPKTKFVAFLTAIGAIVLIGSEIWLAAIATIWAMHGMFDMATAGDLVMTAVVAPIALWATWMTAKLAISAEMSPENAD
jgi:hydrogenase/urease accessory protein HupE